MPERNYLRPATATTVAGTASPNVVSVREVVGHYQSISSLNYGVKPLPGVWSCKANNILRSQTVSTPLPLCKGKDASGIVNTVEGDVAAQMCALSGYSKAATYVPPEAWSTSRANEAINKAYGKIMAADLEVGVMIGELRETLEGIRNPLSAIRKLLKQRRDWSKTDFTNMLSSSWLEWRYGIRPLVQTIQDIYEHVNDTIKGEFDGKMHGKRARAPETVSQTSSTAEMQIGNWYLTFNTNVKRKVRYGASVGYTLTSPLTWQERYGLDAYSLPSIMWELTTLSFVADWWLGLGSWLEALKAQNPKIQLKGLSVSQKCIIEVSCVTTGKARVNAVQNPLSGLSSHEFVLERLVRQCPATAFTGVTPSLNSTTFDMNRSIDALTLLWQTIAKGRK